VVWVVVVGGCACVGCGGVVGGWRVLRRVLRRWCLYLCVMGLEWWGRQGGVLVVEVGVVVGLLCW